MSKNLKSSKIITPLKVGAGLISATVLAIGVAVAVDYDQSPKNDATSKVPRPVVNILSANANAQTVQVPQASAVTFAASGSTRTTATGQPAFQISVTLGGTSYNLTSGAQPTALVDAVVNANSSNIALTATREVYGPNIVYGFQINDGGSFSNYFLEAPVFAAFLAGQYSSGTIPAFDPVNNAYINVPASLPRWNKINMSTLRARWISKSNDFIVADSSLTTIDTSNVAKWLDFGGTLSSLSRILVSGTTAVPSSSQLTTIVNGLATEFLTSDLEIEVSNNSAFNNNTTTRESTVVNSLPALSATKDIHFRPRIRAGATRTYALGTSFVPYSISAPSASWDKNSASSLKVLLHRPTDNNFVHNSVNLRGITYNFTFDNYAAAANGVRFDKWGYYVSPSTPAPEGSFFVPVYGRVDSPNFSYSTYYYSATGATYYAGKSITNFMPLELLREFLAWRDNTKLTVTNAGQSNETVLFNNKSLVSLYGTDFGWNRVNFPNIDSLLTVRRIVYNGTVTSKDFKLRLSPAAGAFAVEDSMMLDEYAYTPTPTSDFYTVIDQFAPIVGSYTIADQLNFTSNQKAANLSLRIYGNTNSKMLVFSGSLLPQELKSKLLAIQYTTTPNGNDNLYQGATWNTLDIDETSIFPNVDKVADSTLGFPAATAKTYTMVNIPAGADSISFRVAPYYDINGVRATNMLTTGTSLIAMRDATRVTIFGLSAFGDTTKPYNINDPGGASTPNSPQPVYVPLSTSTKRQITVQSSWLDQITLTNNTKSLTINGLSTSSLSTLLDSVNTRPTSAQDFAFSSWSDAVGLGFSVNDSYINQNYFFPRDKFILWMSGGVTAANAFKVYDTTTEQMVDLPPESYKPSWNKTNMNTFRVRFIPMSDKYSVSVTTAKTLDTSNLTKWANLTPIFDLLKNLSITGHTRSLSSNLNGIKAELDLSYGSGTAQIESTPTISPATATPASQPDFTSANSGVRINALPSQIKFNFDLAFRIVKSATTTNKIFLSTLEDPTKEAGFVIWDKVANKAAENIRRFVNLPPDFFQKAFYLGGNTRSITYDNKVNDISASAQTVWDKDAIVSADEWGEVVDSNGNYTKKDNGYRFGDIWIKVNAGTNQRLIRLEFIRAWLAGKIRIINGKVWVEGSSVPIDSYFNNDSIIGSYTLTPTNILPPDFDGTWGRNSFQIALLPYYSADASKGSWAFPSTPTIGTSNATSTSYLYKPGLSDSFRTARVIDSFVKYFKAASTHGAADGVNLYGSRDTDNGILVSLPSALVDQLSNSQAINRKLQLQYTTSGTFVNGSLTISTDPVWADANLSNYNAGEVAGSPATAGFKIRMNTLQNNKAFLAFRLVPVQDDNGVLGRPANVSAPLDEYYETTKIHLYVKEKPLDPATPFVSQARSYFVAEGVIAEVLNVAGVNLAQIAATGNTKNIVLSNTALMMSAVAAINPSFTRATIDANLRLVFAIDLADGSFIDGDGGNTNALYLTENDFIAYLAGNLKVLNNKVVYANNTTNVVEAFTSSIISQRGWKNNDVVTPKYLDINTVTKQPPARNSIFAKWATISADYEASSGFVASTSSPTALSYTTTSLKKYIPGKYLNDQIGNIVIRGTTSTGGVNYDFANASDLQSQQLTAVGLAFQYSITGLDNTWSSTLNFGASTVTWDQRVARTFYMRLVPTSYTGANAITNTALTDSNNLYIDYTNITAGAVPNITALDTNQKRLFRTYISVTTTPLASLSIYGNSFALDTTNALNLDESTADNNTAEYSQLQIQYLYNNQWWTKAGLLDELARVRASLTDAQKAADFIPPADFTKDSIKARWHLSDPINYELASQIVTAAIASSSESVDSNSVGITTTNFKTFVNLWPVQDKVTNDFRTTITDGKVSGQSAVIKLTGDASSVSAQLTLTQITNYANFFTTNRVRLQYSIAATPSNSLTSTDWVDATLSPDNTFLTNVTLNANRDLRIRFVPVATYANDIVLSTYSNNALGTDVTPIVINTSEIKRSINTSSAALQALVASGNTQNTFTTNEDTAFLAPTRLPSGAWGIAGVTIGLTTQAELAAWIQTVGLRIEYKVTATRTRGIYVSGREYTFDTLALLKAALDTKHLNFNRSTLRVRYGTSKPNDAVVSDTAWVTPTVTTVVNSVFTEDIYTLLSSTYSVTGNNLKLNPIVLSDDVDATLGVSAKFALETTRLTGLGVKIQFNITNVNNNPSPTAWLDNAPTGGLDQSKNIWVRFAPVSTQYELTTERALSQPSQVTKLQVATLKVAIPFSLGTVQAVKDRIAAAALQGKTYDFNWKNVGQANELSLPEINPTVASAALKNGKLQYSINGTSWSDTIAAALATSDYFNTGVLGFNKDRGDMFHVRYVYSTTLATEVTPNESTSFVYTDSVGNEMALSDLKRAIPISELVEPVSTNTTISLLAGKPVVQVNNGLVVSPKNTTNFGPTKWQEFANADLFSPHFNTSVSGKLSFQYFEYDGLVRETDGNFILGLGNNPFNNTVQNRAIQNALAPRNSHFEYRYRTSETDPWSAWSTSLPVDLSPSTVFKGFATRLVPDQGYELGSYTVGTTFAIDGSTRAALTVPTNEWTREFNVAIKVTTKNISLPADSAAQATFIGWNDSTNPTGLFKTVNSAGDHTPSMNTAQLKNIIVTILNSGVAMNFTAQDQIYVLEWNVRNSVGVEIPWRDSSNNTATGWHAPIFATPNVAPGGSIPWYGNYPVTLKNTDVVSVRLRARDGFIIEGDTASTDYNTTTRQSRWSQALDFAPITTLTNRIDLSANFAIYDRGNLVDFYNQPITLDTAMPTVTFKGNGGQGTVEFFSPDVIRTYGFEVAVLHSIGGLVDADTKAPTQGYVLETYEQQQLPNATLTRIYTRPTATEAGGYVANWQSLLRWQAPEQINNLNIGDAIVVRLKANAGYGFKWENPDNTFVDEVYPKLLSNTSYGSQLSTTPPSGAIDLKMHTPNNGIPPIPVQGLVVSPVVALSALNLSYSSNLLEKLNGQGNVVKLNYTHSARDTWRWEYQVISNGVTPTTWSQYTTQFPSTLSNNDIIQIRAKTISNSILNPNYDNTPIRLTVSELLNILDGTGIARPVITFGGYEGKGTITQITPFNNPATTQWSTPSTSFTLGRPILASENGVPSRLIWEYQVSRLDPSTLSDSAINELAWVQELPTDLRLNYFVRMRAASTQSKEAVVSGTTFIYSVDPTDTQNTYKGFTKLRSIKLDPRNIEYEFTYSGRAGQPRVGYKATLDSLDNAAVTFEYQISVSGVDGDWFSSDLPATEITQKFATLKNGDVVRWRVKAKPGFVIDVNDPFLVTGDTVSAPTDPVTSITSYYFRRNSWETEISRLTTLILTTNVTLGQFKILPMPNNPSQSGSILDGFGMLAQIAFTNGDSVVEARTGNRNNAAGVPYSSTLKVKYILRAVDPLTGSLQAPVEIIDPNVPQGLSNGDVISVEIFSTEPTYELSDTHRTQFVVSGLLTNITEGVMNPVLSFTKDISGSASVLTDPLAPQRTRWIYSVVREKDVQFDGDNNPVLPTVDKDYMDDAVAKEPKLWVFTPPTDLSNGDYVFAMLASAVQGASGLQIRNLSPGYDGQIPRSVAWVPVTGLALKKLNVSAYRFSLYDPKNPFDPTAVVDDQNPINFAFKLVGGEENSTKLQINAELYPTSPSSANRILVDSAGNTMPKEIADEVQWGFAVSDSPDAQNLVFSPTMPTNLRNNQYVYVKLIPKNNLGAIVEGDQVQVFQITGLEKPSSVPNKVVTLVAVIVAGVVTLGIAAAITIVIMRRRRKLHFKDS